MGCVQEPLDGGPDDTCVSRSHSQRLLLPSPLLLLRERRRNLPLVDVRGGDQIEEEEEDSNVNIAPRPAAR